MNYPSCNKHSKVLIVVGTRPNFVKVTQFFNSTKIDGSIDFKLVHTGQHYDVKMSDVFMDQFNLSPDYWLNVGQGKSCQQIAGVIQGLEDVLVQFSADLVMVVGDVNSTLAGGIAANKLGVKVAHLESGLRSFDRSMPEEINRLATDHIADYLFVTEQSGINNLKNEGIDDSRIFFVGNTMIDTLVAFDKEIKGRGIRKKLGLENGMPYALVTMHRPSNVDDVSDMRRTIDLLASVTEKHNVVFPVHPRTAKQMEEFGFGAKDIEKGRLILCKPLSYFDFQCLLLHCQFVLTDSGGIQEESTFRGKPCLTLRPNTERPVTIDIGTNVLCDFTVDAIAGHIADIDSGDFRQDSSIPDLWDGKASERICKILKEKL